MSQVNLFKIQEDEVDTFKNSIESKYELICDSTVGNFHFKLFWQESQGKTNVNWGWAFSIFDEQIKQTQKAPKGIIIIQNTDTEGSVYAISFGGAHFHIDPYCDRDFGFNFASRVKVQQTKLTSTVNTYSKQNKSIHSFRNYDQLEINSGESYTKLKLDIDLAGETIFANNVIEVGSSLKMTLNDDSLDNLVKLIQFVENTASGPKITKIPVFNIVKKPDEIEKLDNRLKKNFLTDNSAVTLSEFDVIGVEEVFIRADSFELNCDDKTKTISSLDLNELKLFFEENNITDVDTMLNTGIRFLLNGVSQVNKPIRNFIDYLDEDKNALLICGKWYKFNTDFCQSLKDSLENIEVIYEPQYDISKTTIKRFQDEKFLEEKDDERYKGLSETEIRQSIRKRYYPELTFNLLREREGYELLDRHLVEIKKEKIELCDLRKEGTIYSVKRGNSSAELSYVVTQSETALATILNQPKEEHPNEVALWLILSRKNQISIKANRLDWDSLRMLLFKIRIDTWKKKVYLAGMKPLIRINYEKET